MKEIMLFLLIGVVVGTCACVILFFLLWFWSHTKDKECKEIRNSDCGWKEYYTQDYIHRFEYWHGDQDGNLYKLINDNKWIVLKTHISIEEADYIMSSYKDTGLYRDEE